MTDDVFPFALDIACRDGRRVSVECIEALRVVAKTRKVYDARWDGRPVIAKVFVKPGKAWYHMRREWRGLEKLKARQVRTPDPLFCGRTRLGWIIVTEKIERAVTGMDIWTGNPTFEEKTSLLCQIGAELARHHLKGVIQTDLHLGNFLIKGDEIFLLDPSTVQFRPSPVGRSRSMKQLARLTSVLPEQDSESAIETVFRQYAAARNWPVDRHQLQRLYKAKERSRQSTIERGLQKFLRTNRRHQQISEGPWRGIAERSFLEAAGVRNLTTRLDEAVSSGQVLKNGRTCFVARMKLGGVEVVAKRYNHKGLIHSLRHTLKGSRAKQGWVRAHRLRLLGIATPRPLAYIVEYRGPLLWRSYLITEFVAGQSLHEVLRDATLRDDRKQYWIDEALQLIDRLGEHNITHGDMKHTNLLCSDDKIVLTDLDAMRVHRAQYQKRHQCQKDKTRFLRDVNANGLRPPGAMQVRNDS